MEFLPSLTLNKIEHFSKVSLHKKHGKRVEKAFATLGSIDFKNIWCYMQTQDWEMFSRLAPLPAIRLVDEHFGRESLGRELRTEMLEAEWGFAMSGWETLNAACRAEALAKAGTSEGLNSQTMGMSGTHEDQSRRG